MVDGTYSSTSREFNPSNKNLYLSKKCYYKADTINGMPWVRANIDLSFPEIKQMVELDKQQTPNIEGYYPLAFQRRESDLIMQEKDLRKV